MKKYLYLFILPAIVFASDAHGGPKDFDIGWRIFNFVLFFGILFYLLKGPIKNAYNNRIDSIAKRLEANQNLLKASKERKEQAKKDLENAKINGASLIETSKKEAVFAEEKLKKATEFEISQLEKSFNETKEFESRKLKKEVVGEILDEVFGGESMQLNQNDLIKIIDKKVV